MSDTQLVLDPRQCAAEYRDGRSVDLATTFLDLLRKFGTHLYFELNEDTERFVNLFVKNFLFYFTQEDFHPSEAQLVEFVQRNPVIANVVAISHFRTTDAHVKLLLGQSANYAKLLALYNPRCETQVDPRALFRANSELATSWYYAYFENYRTGCVTETSWQNLRRHLYAAADITLGHPTGQTHHAYFGATYIDFEEDHLVKRNINQAVRAHVAALPLAPPAPDRRKACVVTAMWFPAHSVYRCMHKFLEALSEEFELTLISLCDPALVDDGLFAGGVRAFDTADPEGSGVTTGEFALAFYPDIGMNVESLLLSNVRIAPVQVCGYGHPVSTWDSEIDYWLGGLETEDIAGAKRNYSERLVLIPGAGVMPNKPLYERRWNHAAHGRVRVNCSWTGQKINFQNLSWLKQIAARCRNRVVYRFFPGASPLSGSFTGMRREITEVLGPDVDVEVHTALEYEPYMAAMENAEFTLDPYPFGGYATATDALFLGKPIVTLEGRKFFNRSAAALLRKCGLECLIATTPDEYIEIAARLVDDAAFRQDCVNIIEEGDLDTTIFADDSSTQFRRAMRYLVDHDTELKAQQSREPLVFR
ncbi:MAG: hypothetical protein AAF458_19890 [Pseudomonadota bacterium]